MVKITVCRSFEWDLVDPVWVEVGCSIFLDLVSDGNSRFSEGIFVHGQAHVQIGPFELIFGGVPVLG